MMNINSQNENSFTNVGTQTGGLNLAQGGQGFAATQSGMSFKDQMGQMVNGISPSKMTGEIDELLKDMDFVQMLSLESMKIDEKDALFYLGLIENNRIGDVSPANLTAGAHEILQNFSAQDIAKSSNVSKTLIDLISNANTTGKPVRIDFDNDITLVLRVDREGKLSAQFFPGDKAAEEYLKNNLPYLKNRFDEQNIPYKELSYRQQKQQQEKENQQENKK